MMMLQPMRPRSTHRFTGATNNYVVASNLLGDFPIAWGGDVLISTAFSGSFGSTNVAIAALLATALGPNSCASLVNGTGVLIVGRYGAGGAAGVGCGNGTAGGVGGKALETDIPMTIENNSWIFAGGGGGGGDGGSSSDDCKGCGCDGGVSAGGIGQGHGGGPGTRGGTYGTAGTVGPNGTDGGCGSGTGGAGGAAGNYSTGESFITWLVTGSRLGGTTG